MPDESIGVLLTWYEVSEAAREGCARRIRRLAKKRIDRYGWDEARDEWGNDIEAVAAEMAFAKALDLYWAPSALPDYDGDVGRWQVRHSARPNPCLIVYPADSDDARFALLVGRIPRFTVVGWVYGAEAKCEKFAAGRRLRVPGYLVPQDSLRMFSPNETGVQSPA